MGLNLGRRGRLILMVAEQRPVSAVALARRWGLVPQTARESLYRLEARGLVRRMDPERTGRRGPRSAMWQTTAKGSTMIDSALSIARRRTMTEDLIASRPGTYTAEMVHSRLAHGLCIEVTQRDLAWLIAAGRIRAVAPAKGTNARRFAPMVAP